MRRKPVEDFKITKVTDTDGCASFAGIPLGVYEVEVHESNSFQGEKKVRRMNLPQMISTFDDSKIQ